MNSFSHYSFGAVMQWAFQTLAGIDTDGPGYRRILVRPFIPGPESNPDGKPLEWVRAEYDSIRGKIVSDWKRDGGKLNLNVTVPANTTATVSIPAKDAGSVRESGQPLDKADGVKFLRIEGDCAVIEVGSGAYRFTSGG